MSWAEIRRHNEPCETSGPVIVRVLNGQLVDPSALALPTLRACDGRTVSTTVIVPPEDKPVPIAHVQRSMRQMTESGRKGGLARAKQKRRGGGRGLGWSLRADVSGESIVGCLSRGMDVKDIARELHCGDSTVRLRITQWKAAHAKEWAALTTCACGKRKYAQSTVCAKCAWRAKHSC